MLTATAMVDISGNVTGAFTATFAGATGNTADGTIDTSNISVTAGSLTAGVIDISGDLTTGSGLAVSATAVTVDGNSSLGGNVTASAGAVTLGDAAADDVTLTANAVLTASAAVDISGSVNGAFDLTLDSGTSTDVDEAVTTSNLTVNGGTDVDLDSATITNLLDINLDTGADGTSTLTAGNLQGGTVQISGQGSNDTMNLNGTVASTTAEVAIDMAMQVNLAMDVTAANGLTVDNVTTVDLAGNVDLVATTGDVNIDDDDVTGIEVSGSAGSANSVTATAGNVILTNVSLEASGNTDSFTANAGNGNLTINEIDIAGAGTQVVDLIASGSVLDDNTGTNNVTADQLVISTTTGSAGVDGGDVLETTVGTLAAATGDDLAVTNTGALTVGSVTGPVSGTVNGVTAGGDVEVIALSPLTVSQAVVANAGGNIELTATNDGGDDDDLTISANVTATGGNGAIDLNAGTDLIVDSDAVISTVGMGNIDADADRAIDISGSGTTIQTASGNITLTANAGGVSGTFAGIDINDATVTTTAGDISLTGTGGDAGTGNHGVLLDNGALVSSGAGASTITIMGTGGAGTGSDGVQMSGSDITSVDAAVSVTGMASNGGGVDLLSSSGISTTGAGANITIMGTTTSVNGASDGVLLASSDLDTMGGTVSVTGSTAGGTGVQISVSTVTTTGGTGTIGIMGTSTGGGSSRDGVRLQAAGTQIASDTGDITITGTTAGGGTGGDGVEIGVGIATAINATNAAGISITGTGDGANSAVRIDSPISSGTGTVTITSLNGDSTTDDITFGAAGDITSTSGTITINADNAGDTADVVMADGTVINAGSGLIDIDADVDVSLGSVTTTGNVNVTAVTGSISDGGITDDDVVADTATLSAATGIGSLIDNLDTDVASLTASTSGTGGIFVDEADAIDLVSVITADGVILVTAGGNITATSVDSSATDDNTNQIQLMSAAAIDVTSIVAGTMNDVLLDANGGAITESGATDVVADLLSADATDSITLDTTVSELDIDTTGASDIDIDNENSAAGANGLTITSLATAGGMINVDHNEAGGFGDNDPLSITGTVSSGGGGTDGGNIEIRAENDGFAVQNGAVVSSLDGTGGNVLTFGVSLLAGSTVSPGAGDITLIGGGDLIVETDIISVGDIDLAAPRDVIIRATVQSTGGFVDLTADETLMGMPDDGNGGVLIEGNGLVDAATNVTLTGANLFNDGNTADFMMVGDTLESVVIDVDTDTSVVTSQVSAAGNISLVSEATMSPTGADIIINGVINSTGALTTSVDADGDILLGNNVTGTNNVDFNDDVVITDGVASTDTVMVMGANVDFDGTVEDDALDGNAGLIVNGSGTTTFTGEVGGNGNDLDSVMTDAAGSTVINGGAVTTSGNQTYGDDVTLGADTTLTGSTIKNTDTIDGSGDGTESLDIVGNADIDGEIGGGSGLALGSFTVSGTTAIESDVTTTDADVGNDANHDGRQVYTGAVTLTGDTTLNGVDVTFQSTIDDDGTVGDANLIVNGSGTTTFNGQVGNNTTTSDLTSLTTDAAGDTTINTDVVNTTADQTYGDAVTIEGGASPSTTTFTGSNVTFDNTLDADDDTTNNRSLIFTVSSDTTFNNQVGNRTMGGGGAFEAITTDAAGTTNINTDEFVTNGSSQTFNDAVVMMTDTTLTENGPGNITFNNTVDSETDTMGGSEANDLVINTPGGGTTVFNADVGEATDGELGNITTDAAGSTTVADGVTVTTIEDQTYNDEVNATNATFNGDDITATVATNDFMGTTSFNATGDATITDENDIDFGNSAIDGNLVLISGGNVTDSGNVTVTGMTTITAVGNVLLDEAGTDLGDTVVTANSLTIQNDAGGVNLQDITVTTFLLVESSDDITNDDGVTIDVGTTATFRTFNDTGGDITIDTLLFSAGGAITAEALQDPLTGTALTDGDIRILELADSMLLNVVRTLGDVSLETHFDVVVADNNNVDIFADGLALRARTGLGTAATDLDIDTDVNTLAALNEVSNAIVIENNSTGAATTGDSLTVGTVDTLNGVENMGDGVITLTNNSPVVISMNMTANNTITVNAVEGTGNDSITVNSGVTLLTSSGDINLNAGDGITVNQGSSINAENNINLMADVGDNDNVDNEDSVTLSGNFQAVNGVVTVTLASTNADNNTVDASLATGDGMTINGASGNDTITGTAQVDSISGGAGGDQIIGGGGGDILNGGDDNDVFIWNNGDASDTVEGDGGTDRQEVNLDIADDNVIVRETSTRLEVERTTAGPFTLDIGTLEELELNTAAGADTVTVNDLAALATPLTDFDVSLSTGNDTFDARLDNSATPTAASVLGEAGNDTLFGGAAVDTLDGGDQDDSIEGSGGDDSLLGGAGNDTFMWRNGDASDDVDGGDGTDRQNITMSGAGADIVEIRDDAGQLEVERTVTGPFTLELDNMEELEVNSDDGVDQVTVQDLSGLTTDLSDFDVDLGAGNDIFNASADNSPTDATAASVLGGDDNDSVTGGAAVDTISGGSGFDTITGSGGDDILNGDAGDDLFVWANGDASDVVEGGADNDMQEFNITGTQDDITVRANAGRLEVERTNANPFLVSSGGVESLDIDADDLDDNLVVDELQSLSTPLASATFALGDGNDTFDASADASTSLSVDGGTGTDAIIGSDAVDTISGGAGNDTITGGGGSDVLNGGDNDDLFIWNNGDASDTVEGDGGTDRQEVNLDIADDNVTVSEAGTRLAVARTTAGPFTLDIGTVEELELNTAAGADTVTVSDLAALTTALTDFDVSLGSGADTFDAGQDNSVTPTAASVLGEAGNDTLVGGAAVDTLDGGDQDDSIEGSGGDDSLIGGNGDDTFMWRNTDASDDVDGGAGDDTLIFDIQGSTDELSITEENAGQLRVARTNVNTFNVDADGIENLDIDANGNDDIVTVGDLSGLTQALTSAMYRLGGGADEFDARADASTAVSVLGETGDDTIRGSDAADTISGGADNDSITGDGGDDLLQGDDGNDTFVWNNTDASDDIFGGVGTDTSILNGNVAGTDALTVDPSASGAFDFEISRGADFTLEITEVESQTINADGGTGSNDDSVTVSEISSTNGSLTNLTINGDGGVDTVNITNSAVNITVSGGAGDDVVDATNSSMGLEINGDADNDLLTGSSGVDLINGGAGNDSIDGNPGDDVLNGDAGNDSFVWNQGDNSDMINGGTETDSLDVNGSTLDDNLAVSGSGTRFTVSRDNFGPFSLDVGTVENLNIDGGDGNDTVTVNDLSGVSDLANAQLNGDGGTDEFVLNDGGLGANVTGNIDGGADNDTLNVSNLTAAETVDLEGQSSTSVAGFTSIESFTGDATNDILQATSGADTFDITGEDDGTVAGAAFTDFSILQGLGGEDTFTLNGGRNTGSIDGGAGTDSLNLDNFDNATNITAPDAGNSAGVDAGDATGVASFTSIGNVTGGSEADDFVFADGASLSGILDGGAGSNSLTENSADNVLNVTGNDSGTADNITGGFTGIGSLDGGAGADDITISAAGDLSGNVDGSAGDDEIIFQEGGIIQGNVDGGADTDLLDYSAFTSAVNVDLEAGTATSITGSVSNIENATGGSAADTLTGDGNANVLNGGGGNDTIDGNGGPDTMSGGDGDDFFIWNNTDGSDMIDGNADNDSLQVNLDGAADNLNISDADGAGAGTRLDITRTTPGVFTLDVDTVENLEVNAGAMNDTVTFTNDVSGTSLDTTVINGGDGNDTLDANLANEPVTLNGEGGDDSLTGGSMSDLLDGGSGDDTLTGGGSLDTLLGEDGDDLFIWNNGDATEPVRGGSGFDTQRVNANDGLGDELTIGRISDVVNPGPDDFTDRVSISRPNQGAGLGAFELDIDEVERLEVNGLGGDDDIQVDGLRSTDVEEIELTGGDGDDFFDIVPTIVMPIVVDGGSDTGTPGDRLMFQAAGSVDEANGTIVAENGVTQIEFTNLDAFTRQVLAGVSEGNLPNLQVIDPTTGATLETIDSFTNTEGAIHTGGVRTAIGDVNGDGITDIVAAAGPGAGPHVKVFSGTDGSLLQSFYAYDLSFTGGVHVAVGDVDNDGFDDIITGADFGAGPHVKVFSGSTQFFPSVLHSFYAYDLAYAGGVTVAAGDITGDGVADIITGAANSGGPHVKVFNGPDAAVVDSFFAFDRTHRDGVTVSAGDTDSDGDLELLVGAPLSSGSEARIFDDNSDGIIERGLLPATVVPQFTPFGAGVTLPIEVSSIDNNSDGVAELVVTAVTENSAAEATTGSSATVILDILSGNAIGLGGLNVDLGASITGGGLTIAAPRLQAP